jgi:SAM-dependent methyltransferase
VTAFYETVAHYYDAEMSDKSDDLALYSELAEEYGSPIFDVGCGTGRVLLHLAQEGHKVFGVDDSSAMLRLLQNKLNAMPHLKENVGYAKANILTYQAKEKYKLVLLTYNALMHFHEQETQIKLLQNLRQLTDDNGLLILDLPNAGEVFNTPETSALVFDREFIEGDSGHLVMLSSHSNLDRSTQILDVTWIYDEVTGDGSLKRLRVPHRLRYFFLPELTLLLERCGFAVEEAFGSTEGDPFVDGCERMLVYARPS